jgi:hydroxypyruvate reductase
MKTDIKNKLEQIFRAGLERVNPYEMIKKQLRVDGNIMTAQTELGETSINISDFEKIYVTGAGKASAKMAKAIEELLYDNITEGAVCVKYDHTEELKKIKILEAGHPMPDENGEKAGKKIVDLVKKADEKTLIINLISGGGSALLPVPLTWTYGDEQIVLTLKDKRETTKALLECGATIYEINCIRKHLSGVKGGRLLQHASPARTLNFILSDVVGDSLDTIASGMTTYDKTTYQDALDIINKYNLSGKLSENVIKTITAGVNGDIEETVKKGDEVLRYSENIMIGTNYSSLYCSDKKAKELGYNTLALTSQVTGEASELAKFIMAIGRDIADKNIPVAAPACIIVGGETTVTLKGKGKGGRNQEMALAFLEELGKRDYDERLHFLSASTDGTDGPTDATGAFADMDILRISRENDLNIRKYLSDNDSYHFFEKIDYLLKTGPTNTNVCDLHIIIIE